MRGLYGAGLAVLMVTSTGAAAPPTSASAGGDPAVKPAQELAALVTSHKVVSRVRDGAVGVTRVQASRPITGGQTVLPVLDHTTTAQGVRWLEVLVPGRPNGRSGWIKERGTVRSTTSWRLVVRTAQRKVVVYRHGRRVRSFSVVVGKPATPTPRGRFFVEESVRMLRTSAGAPFALALSARSNVLQEFEGGPGQIALHGVANLGGTPGTAASHGCVRLSNAQITWLSSRVGPGAPVTIRR
ncbi:MAG: L,D-transpeptidase [Thermoleophilaceae bacterium]